jgi:hypothetical protein
MRVAPFVVAVLVVALLIWGVNSILRRIGANRELKLHAAARWVFRHYDNGPERVMTASKVVPVSGHVLEEIVVDSIPENAPDFAARYDLAEMEAEERVAQLNRGGNIEQIRRELEQARKQRKKS